MSIQQAEPDAAKGILLCDGRRRAGKRSARRLKICKRVLITQTCKNQRLEVIVCTDVIYLSLS